MSIRNFAGAILNCLQFEVDNFLADAKLKQFLYSTKVVKSQLPTEQEETTKSV